jgi:hypothetical protein
VGTWGAGPFANDSADELVQSLEGATPTERSSALTEVLEAGVRDGEDADPSEIVAAAAIVVASLPGRGLEGEGHPQVEGWLDARTAADVLRPLAARALEACLPDDGWYWESWTDDGDRAQARALVGHLVEVLRDR